MLYGQPEAIFRINAMLVADGVFSLFVACRVVGRLVGGAKQLAEPSNSLKFPQKKQGATGITTVAPYIAGRWGRGNNRLLKRLTSPGVVPADPKFFQIFLYTVM